jgi:hypothetical protein
MGERRYSSSNLDLSTTRSASLSSRLVPAERVTGTHWTGGRVGRRAGLNIAEKRKISCPAGNRTLAVQPVVSRYIDGQNKVVSARYSSRSGFGFAFPPTASLSPPLV